MEFVYNVYKDTDDGFLYMTYTETESLGWTKTFNELWFIKIIDYMSIEYYKFHIINYYRNIK